MNRLLALLACLCPALLLAQVDARVSLDQDVYLPGETINVSVQVANFTGRKLTFGKETQWVRFHLEASEGGVVNQTAEVQDSGEFSLDSSTRGTLRYDLQPLFDLSRPGRYRVSVLVTTPDREEVQSQPVAFEVIRGSRLWEREVGLPGKDDSERRKYLLQQANHLRDVRLYVRVTDASEATTFKVIRVGRMVTFAKPQTVVDRVARLHLLNQMTAEDYVYLVVDPNGAVVSRDVYSMVGDRRPLIRMNDAGEVAVIGGQRRTPPQAPKPAGTSTNRADKPDAPRRDTNPKP